MYGEDFLFSQKLTESIDAINSTVKTVLIISGTTARTLLPRIHHLANIESIMVYCGNWRQYKAMMQEFPKIKFVEDDPGRVMDRAGKLL